MNDRSLSRLWVPLTLVYIAVTTIGVLVAWQTEGELIHFVQTVPGFTALAVVGSVLVARRPRNPIGWPSRAPGCWPRRTTRRLSWRRTVWSPPAALSPFPVIVGDIAQFWLAGSSSLLRSRLSLSNRQIPVVWMATHCNWAVGLLPFVATGRPPHGNAEIPVGPELERFANPLFVRALAPLAGVLPVLFPSHRVALVVATASLVARYRRGSTVEKQQLKWILLAAMLMVASLVAQPSPRRSSGYSILCLCSRCRLPSGSRSCATAFRHRPCDQQNAGLRSHERRHHYPVLRGNRRPAAAAPALTAGSDLALARRPSSPSRYSIRSAGGCRAQSIAGSTALATTPRERSMRSPTSCATRSIGARRSRSGHRSVDDDGATARQPVAPERDARMDSNPVTISGRPVVRKELA